MFRSCHVDEFVKQKLIIFGSNEIWGCTLNHFILELVHERMFDICHLRGLMVAYPKHGFVDFYVQTIPNWFENLHHTQM